jgi:8-oxo-dGTP pyrophosphatase MutT (NUDIX family)
MSHHQAQISFPGGRKEPQETISQAALREAREELGILPESVRVLGELTPLYIPPSNFCIYPVVATTLERPVFSPSPKEVSEAIEVPLTHLLDPRNRHEEEWEIRNMKVTVPFFEFKGHKVWGATAMVLAELLDLIRRKEG